MKIRERLRLRQLASSNSEVPDVNQGHRSIKTEKENPAANNNKHQSYSEQELNVSLKDGLNLTEEEKKGVIQTNIGIENAQQFGEMLQNMLPRSGDGRIMASPINPMAIQAQLRQMNPELSHEELVSRTRAAIMQLQNMHRFVASLGLNLCHNCCSGRRPP